MALDLQPALGHSGGGRRGRPHGASATRQEDSILAAPHDAFAGEDDPAATATAAADEVEGQIFALLALRKPGATICPSEVARALAGDPGAWRERMPGIRRVAQRLADGGRLRVTRGGVEVDAASPGGPIRLGRPDAPPA